MDRLLTITIPAYNAEAFLGKCLDSLLSCRLRKETELLVIDDGSSDRTGRIADAYAARYPDIVRVIHKKNGGHGSGINAGIAAAGGKYFRIVDSDDSVDSGAYEAWLQRLKQIDSDLIVTPFVRVRAGGERFRRREELRPPEGAEGLPRGKVLAFEDVSERLFVRMHECAIRTSILREHSIRISEHSFYVDMQYVLFPVPWIRTCCFLDFPVYRYRLGDENQSVSVKSMQKNRGQHRRVLRSLVRFCREREEAGDSEKRLAYLARGIAKMQANQVQTILSLPICRAVKRELITEEQWLKRECPAAWNANEKKSLRLLRQSGYRLYGIAALAWRGVRLVRH